MLLKVTLGSDRSYSFFGGGKSRLDWQPSSLAATEAFRGAAEGTQSTGSFGGMRCIISIQWRGFSENILVANSLMASDKNGPTEILYNG